MTTYVSGAESRHFMSLSSLKCPDMSVASTMSMTSARTSRYCSGVRPLRMLSSS